MLIFTLLGAVIASLVLGGVLYCFVHSGRLSIRKGAAKAAPALTGTRLLVLDPLLVNLADEGGSSYLRLSLTLQVADAAGTKDSKVKNDGGEMAAVRDTALTVLGQQTAAVRDTALTVLGQQTADGLLAPDGKERLKDELKNALTRHNGDLKVTTVFFTDFLVQR
jgi:flagellar FliL protein